MGDFPNQINVQPSPGVEGDFCDTNPRYSAIAGPGGFVAASPGVTIGRFVWYSNNYFDVDDTSQQVSNSFNGVPSFLTTTPGNAAVLGFVGRAQQGLIPTYLQASGMLIPTGFPVTVFSSGDFFVKNAGTSQAVQGMKCYANLATGQATFAAPGSASVSTCNGSISTGNVQFTGSIAGNVLTVTAVASGVLAIGTQITTGGTGLVANTAIVTQLTGTANGTGTYLLNIPEQTVAAASLTGTYGVLTVTSTISTTNLAPGQLLSGTGGGGLAASTYITALGTGTGGTGTYYLNNTQTVTQTIIGYQTNVETKWYAMSGGQTNELIKISAQALG
jgi:hypothetical protein